MLKKNNKVKVLSILLFFTILLPMLILQSDFSSKIETNDNQEQIDKEDDKIESSAVITNEIRINGTATGVGAHNWTWAKNEGYVRQGDGSQGNPYIISNLIIDGQNSHGGIIIEDSREKMTFPLYFRIENNLIYNVGGPNSKSAGIKLYKTQYGTIRNNNISSNMDGNYGIHIVGYLSYGWPFQMDTSKYINITENTISNTERGIYMQEGCESILVSKNVATSNTLAGIYITRRCLRITVIKNILSENDVFGIADTDSNNHNMPEMSPMDMDVNIIKNNTIYNNAYGFYLSQTKGSKISYNNISSNSITGIYISGSYWNYIANNTISDNGDKGILMVMGPIGSFKNRIYRNKFLRNGEHAVELTNPPPFYILGWENNWSWWQGLEYASPLIGNYWDNYTGKDVDDDGFGDAPYNFTNNEDKCPIWNDGIEGHVIVINETAGAPNNWNWAKGRFWCSGGISGPMDPYIIGPNINHDWDGKIDAWGKNFGISIISSNAYQFRIEKISIKNSSVAGIKLYNVEAMKTVIINNNISFNNGHGIYLEKTHYLNITGNIIDENEGTGIYLCNNSGWWDPQMNIKIMNNIISDNDDDGIYIGVNDCDNNNITTNLIAENGRYGVCVNETTILGCNNTTFYNNTFRGNMVKNAYDTGTNTKWYLIELFGFGRGNSWDDYIGNDNDDDGIGEDPYNKILPALPLKEDKFPIHDDGLNVKELLIDASASGVNAQNWTWASRRLYVSGSGSSWDPYVIKNVKFNGTDLKSPITILNSAKPTYNVYFRIENCALVDIGNLNSGSAGIRLFNTDNGELINNTFSTKYEGNYGIYLQKNCENINNTANLIENDYGSPEFKYGIYLNDCASPPPNTNVIRDNIISYNYIGIFLYNYSSSNNISNNKVSNNDAGIVLNYGSAGNNIFRNNIYENGNGTLIKNNCLTNNIFDNDIIENTKYGLYINASSNQIYYNNFTDNGENAKDDTPIIMGVNTWYKVFVPTGRGNFWSNYTTDLYSVDVKDQDDDGIGDIPYNLTGIAKIKDLYPIFDDGHNGSKVIIDGSLPSGFGSWEWAAGRTWCSGSGTLNDPYVISGLNINGRLNSSCIYIHNSQTTFFRIENCRLYNSSETESPEFAGGIRLIKVSNALIINNNISNNDGCGIILMSGFVVMEETSNITIRNNLIENNNGTGIYINGSFVFDNLIENNTISSNKIYGISVSNNAYEITILDNILYDNAEIGIYIKDFQPSWPMMIWDPIEQKWIYEPWDRNYIYNNTITLGDTGIGIESSYLVEISNNEITLTESNGIALQGTNCGNNTILQNTIYSNFKYGINFGWEEPSYTANNFVLENKIYDNDEAGIILQQCYNSNYSKNILDGNKIGIALSYLDSYNLFTRNMIFNSIDRGLGIFDLSCESNLIYNNNFTNNFINAEDLGLSNEWYINTPNMKEGNYWDDYSGKDTDDNGIGDIPYDNIGGFMEPEDHFPKWWDAPAIEILSPSNGDKFSSIAPNFEIKVSEGKGQKLWYIITQTGGTSYFSLTGSFDEEISNQISPSLWSAVTSSLNVVITFYINDSKGYINSMGVTIVKENVTAQTTPAVSSGDNDDDGATDTTTEEEQLEEDFPWWLRAILTGIISASAGLVLKISYSVHKHRKEFLRKVAENMERIDNIEKFLKQKLGPDWNIFQESWDKYQKQEITQKKLIKEGRKNVGKKFLDIFTKSKD